MLRGKKGFIGIHLIVLFLYCGVCCAVTTKQAEDVFGKLVKKQKLHDFIDVSTIAQDIEGHLNGILTKYKTEQSHLNVLEALLKAFGEKEDFAFKQPLKIAAGTKANLEKMYKAIDTDVAEFITVLRILGFSSSQSNEQEEKLYAEGNSQVIVDRYKTFMQLLLAQKTDELEQRYLLSAACKFFHWCFGEKSFPEFHKILLDKDSHSIARLLYTTIWWNLAGTGWRIWNEGTLRLLKQEADRGKRITYIAGGSDLFRLISRGVYNITMIDPQLPTQPKYYTDQWAWLVKGDDKGGGIGDKIEFNNVEGKKIVMERTSFTEGESFSADVSGGATIKIPSSKTVWSIRELRKSSEYLGPLNFFPFKPLFTFFKKVWNYITSFFAGADGTLILDRRFVKQEDFVYDPNRVIHMSFNEIFYISVKDWGVDPRLFDNRVVVYCKQLGGFVSKLQMCNIHDAFLAEFHFIRLGSCIN